jgi:magnesium-protoporphyrin O-methyltransferase
MLLDAITPSGVTGATFLDIGGGVGAIQHALMRAGAASGTSVDASPAYLHAARDEATAQGYVDRMRYVEGDFKRHSSGNSTWLDRLTACS